jgi:c-di-AMP phosphodiesterase-like protein
MEEAFWFTDLSILYKNCYIFFPSPKYSLIQNLNAIVRFFILYTIFCFVLYQKIEVFMPLVLIMVISLILYYFREYIKEPFKNNNEYIKTEIRKSTPSNPMMNLSVMDYNSKKNIQIDEKITNEEINKNLNGDLFDDIIDVSNKNMFERNFYTTPINTIPNDQTEFAKWLYDKGPTCKEKTIECVNTIPERLSMGRSAN